MKTTDLVRSVAGATDLSTATSRQAVETMLAVIVEAAVAGEDILLAGFGKFSVKHSAARKGRNPATGAEIDIPASRSLRFTPAKAVKDALAPPAPAPTAPTAGSAKKKRS